MMGLTKGPAEHVQFQADAAAAAAVARVQLPVEVSARKGGYQSAFAAARGVLHQIEAEARQLQLGPAEVQPAAVRFAREEKGTVLAQVSAVLTVVLAGEAQFWPRAEAVARVLDLVHRFCDPPKPDKDVAVYAGPARADGASPPPLP